MVKKGFGPSRGGMLKKEFGQGKTLPFTAVAVVAYGQRLASWSDAVKQEGVAKFAINIDPVPLPAEGSNTNTDIAPPQ